MLTEMSRHTSSWSQIPFNGNLNLAFWGRVLDRSLSLPISLPVVNLVMGQGAHFVIIQPTATRSERQDTQGQNQFYSGVCTREINSILAVLFNTQIWWLYQYTCEQEHYTHTSWYLDLNHTILSHKFLVASSLLHWDDTRCTCNLSVQGTSKISVPCYRVTASSKDVWPSVQSRQLLIHVWY